MQEVLDNDVRPHRLLLRLFTDQKVGLITQELKASAARVLIACACLQYPVDLARSLMAKFIDLLRTSPSWRTRLDVLLPLQSKLGPVIAQNNQVQE